MGSSTSLAYASGVLGSAAPGRAAICCLGISHLQRPVGWCLGWSGSMDEMLWHQQLSHAARQPVCGYLHTWSVHTPH